MLKAGARPATLLVSQGMFGFSCAAFELFSMPVEVFACSSIFILLLVGKRSDKYYTKHM